MTMEKIIKVNKVSKKYGSHLAVDNVSFDVNDGEVLGLLGPNGAGKTTLINMLTGLITVSKGEITLFGKPVGNTKNRERIGLVPQNLAIYYDLSARENVAFFGGIYGLRGKILKEKTDVALRTVGLEKHADQKPDSFSGGMQRRLNIAMAIVHEPDLVIMDEPTVGIDPQSRNYILEAIEKMKKDGKSIIYTSHYIEEVERIADRVVIVDHGTVIAQGTEGELTRLITDQKALSIMIRQPDDFDVEWLKNVIGVNDVILKEQSLTITTNPENNVLNEVLAVLLKHDITVEQVDQEHYNLETVFLTLTGRALRDE